MVIVYLSYISRKTRKINASGYIVNYLTKIGMSNDTYCLYSMIYIDKF